MSINIVPRRRGNRIYYEEVESLRIQGKNKQIYRRYIGKDPNAPPNKFPLSPTQFGYLAIRLMEDKLSANDVFDLLEQQGQRFSKEALAKIGLLYSFGEKTFSLCLYRPRSQGRKSATKLNPAPRSVHTKQGRGNSPRSKGQER